MMVMNVVSEQLMLPHNSSLHLNNGVGEMIGAMSSASHPI